VLPLTDASAISYSQTLYMTLFGDLILGEKATPLKWFIVLVGFAGAIVVAHPIGGSMTIVYLLIIAGTSLNALTIVLGRLLQRKDTAATTMFYPAFVNVLIFTPLTYQGDWHPSWLWTGILVLGPLGVCAGMYAVRYAEVAILAPWFYTRLIVAAFIGIVVMREIPDWWTIGGISMIVASCVMTVMFAGERRGSRLRIAE
jgi:drug/metabolite transporter (DMT)-like permease